MQLDSSLFRSRTLMMASALTAIMSGSAQAQSILDPSTWFATGPEGDKQRQQELKAGGGTREYKPRQFGLWLVESSADLGAVYDSNLYSSRTNTKSATGVMLSPRVTGRYTDGGQNATFYLDGNARYFSSENDISTFSGRIGLGNSLELNRGTVWKVLAQFGRSQDDSGAFNATGLGSGSSGVYVKPINSNSLFAATSILSRLDYAQFNGFVSGGLSANLARFEDAELSDGSKVSQNARDTNSYTATGRVGWSFLPVAYAFVEPAAVWQQVPNVTDGDTTTYRVTAGIGTDRINLMKGEIFAGYARQSFNDLTDQARDGAVYGMRLSWFPTRDLTLNLSADDTLGVTAANVSGATQVYTSRTKSISGDLNYSVDRRVSVAIRSTFSNVEYTDTGRKDDIFRLGADLTYMVTGNMGLRAGYTNVNVNSTSDLNNISRDVYSIGLNARF